MNLSERREERGDGGFHGGAPSRRGVCRPPNPEPQIPNSKSQTPNPNPQTSDPNPQTSRREVKSEATVASAEAQHTKSERPNQKFLHVPYSLDSGWGDETLVPLSLRLKDLLGPVPRVKTRENLAERREARGDGGLRGGAAHQVGEATARLWP